MGMSRVEPLAPGLLFKLTDLQLIGNHRSPCWSLPSGLSAVRPGPPDHPAPFHPALGGDLAAAVKAMTAVVVVILNVLGHQLQAVGAAGQPWRGRPCTRRSRRRCRTAADPRGRSGPRPRLRPACSPAPVLGPCSDHGQSLPECRRTGALGGRRGSPRPQRGRPGYCCWPLLRAAPLLPAPVTVPLGLLPAGRPPA